MDLEPVSTFPKPYLRGRLHQVAMVVSLVGLVWLVDSAPTPRARAVAWVYGLASALLYLTSSSYHVFAVSPRSRRIMQRADHAMIFVLIAGSFTPSAVLLLPDPWRWWSLAFMWGGAAFGIGLKIVADAVMDASIAYEKLTNSSKDHQEAVTAFLSKRKPVFTGK